MQCCSCEDWPAILIDGKLFCDLCAERLYGPEYKSRAEVLIPPTPVEVPE